MTLKLYLAGIIFTTALALAAFFLVIGFFSPEGADAFLLGLLFFSLFIGSVGVFGLAGYFIRRKKQNDFMSLSVSFRQGALLSVLLAGSLALKTFGIFWWGSGLVLLILVVATEIFALRRR